MHLRHSRVAPCLRPKQSLSVLYYHGLERVCNRTLWYSENRHRVSFTQTTRILHGMCISRARSLAQWHNYHTRVGALLTRSRFYCLTVWKAYSTCFDIRWRVFRGLPVLDLLDDVDDDDAGALLRVARVSDTRLRKIVAKVGVSHSIK